MFALDILPITNNMVEAPHISYHWYSPFLLAQTQRDDSDLTAIPCVDPHSTSGLALPFPSGHFDLVHTRKLLSSVAEFEALVAESLRVLAPEGLGVWVEGRNVSTSLNASPALESTKGGLKGMMVSVRCT